ncbi:MAG: NusG domain II-containing protein [Candidatus Zixiibacteriota bacterium]
MANATSAKGNSTEKYKPKFQDFILIIIIIIISLLPYILSNENNEGNHYRIIIDNQIEEQGSLEEDTLFSVMGEIGKVTVNIENGKIGIFESSCPNKYCIKMGMSNSHLRPIVCLPNKLLIEIEQEDREELDAIVK